MTQEYEEPEEGTEESLPLEEEEETSSLEETEEEEQEPRQDPDVRRLYSRLGNVEQQNQTLLQTVQTLTQELQTLRNAPASQPPPPAQESNIYATLDAEQRKAAESLVRDNPVVRELKEQLDSLRQEREQTAQMFQMQREAQIKSVLDTAEQKYGKDVFSPYRTAIEAMYKASGYQDTPEIAAAIQGFQNVLEGSSTKKQQSRARAGMERGRLRKGKTLPTAKIKTQSGRVIWSPERAMDIALKIAQEGTEE